MSIVGVLTEVRSLDCDAEVQPDGNLRHLAEDAQRRKFVSQIRRIMGAKGVKAARCSSPGPDKIFMGGCQAAAKLSTPEENADARKLF